MNIILKVNILLIIVINSFLNIAAHEPNEIIYEIENNNIRILLTPKSIIDLIDYLDKELNELSVIKISDYDCMLENYFNNNVKLFDRDRPIYLNYTSNNLLSHNAYLIFNLSSSLNIESELKIEIQAFHEIYPDVSEQVFIRGSRWK